MIFFMAGMVGIFGMSISARCIYDAPAHRGYVRRFRQSRGGPTTAFVRSVLPGHLFTIAVSFAATIYPLLDSADSEATARLIAAVALAPMAVTALVWVVCRCTGHPVALVPPVFRGMGAAEVERWLA